MLYKTGKIHSKEGMQNNNVEEKEKKGRTNIIYLGEGAEA